MGFATRPARDDESDFAWSLYGPFIVDKIYPVSKSPLAKSDWLNEEQSKFRKRWSALESYVLEVDGTRVGWASLHKSNNRVIVQNIFVIPGESLVQVGTEFVLSLLGAWKAGGRTVEVPVLKGGPDYDQIIRALDRLGFKETADDSLATTMTSY